MMFEYALGFIQRFAVNALEIFKRAIHGIEPLALHFFRHMQTRINSHNHSNYNYNVNHVLTVLIRGHIVS